MSISIFSGIRTLLYYYGARYYDPRTSVWQSPDPILNKYLPTGDKKKDAKLPAGGVFNSGNLNLFAYTAQNPVKYIDPNGKFPILTELWLNVRWEITKNYDDNLSFFVSTVAGYISTVILAVPAFFEWLYNKISGKETLFESDSRGLIGTDKTMRYLNKDVLTPKVQKALDILKTDPIRSEEELTEEIENGEKTVTKTITEFFTGNIKSKNILIQKGHMKKSKSLGEKDKFIADEIRHTLEVTKE